MTSLEELPESPVFSGRKIFENSSVRAGVVLPLPKPKTVYPKKTRNVEKAAKEARQAISEFIYFIYQNLQINAKNLDLFLRIKIHITDYLHSELEARPPLSTEDQKFLLAYIRNSEFNNIINAVLESVSKINAYVFDKSIAEGIANMILINDIEKANEDKEKILAIVDKWALEKQRKRDEKARVQRLQDEAMRLQQIENAEHQRLQDEAMRLQQIENAEHQRQLDLTKSERSEIKARKNFEQLEEDARKKKTVLTTKNLTRNIHKNIAAYAVTAKRTANAAANAAANRAAAAKRESNAAAIVMMAGTAAALRTLVNELVNLPTTYLPKKTFFSSEPVETVTYKEIAPQLHAILSTTITDPMRGSVYKTEMNSGCFKEYLIHTLKKLHEFLIKFKSEISLLEKEVARGQTVKIPVLAEKKEDLQRKIQETAASIAQAITGGVTNTVWRENIEFIEGRPIRFKREDAKTYPKCEAEINKNKQLLTESGKSILAAKNMEKESIIIAEEADAGKGILARKIAANAANIAATPLAYLPTSFPFRNTAKKALYRRLIPKITARVEEILKNYKYNKDAIKRLINSKDVRDCLIEYLRTNKNVYLSPEDELRVVKKLVEYLFKGCPAKVPTTPFQDDVASGAMLQGLPRKVKNVVEDEEYYNARILANLRQPVEPHVPIGSSSLPRGTIYNSLEEEGNSTYYTGGGGRRSHKKSGSKGRDATRRGRRARAILRGPRTFTVKSKKNSRRAARRTRRRSSS
jgi:hypothetical protein